MKILRLFKISACLQLLLGVMLGVNEKTALQKAPVGLFLIIQTII